MKYILALVAIGAAVLASQAFATQTEGLEGPNGEHKVVVCKYVGTPGVDETLQTGQNPIVVDYHALGSGFDGTFPFAFSDAQGHSLAVQWTDDVHFSDLSVCPAPEGPPEEPALDCNGDEDATNNGVNGDCTETPVIDGTIDQCPDEAGVQIDHEQCADPGEAPSEGDTSDGGSSETGTSGFTPTPDAAPSSNLVQPTIGSEAPFTR